MLPTEEAHFTKRDAAEGWRLSCQTAVKQDMKSRSEEVFGVKQGVHVVSNPNVATFIKADAETAEGENVDFRAGGYVQLECPPHHVKYADFDIEPEYRGDWEHFGFFKLESVVKKRLFAPIPWPITRKSAAWSNSISVSPRRPPGQQGYSPASCPPGCLTSNPVTRSRCTDPLANSSPSDTDAEMVFIGGGAGMAPMRSHLFDQLKRLHSKRKISFWYGARSMREMFYQTSTTSSPRKIPISPGRSPCPTRSQRTTGRATPGSSTTCFSRST